MFNWKMNKKVHEVEEKSTESGKVQETKEQGGEVEVEEKRTKIDNVRVGEFTQALQGS